MGINNLVVERYVRSPFHFPITDEELISTLSFVESDLQGLKRIEVAVPRKTAEYGYFGKYDDYFSVMVLYAPVYKEGVYILGRFGSVTMNEDYFRDKILGDTIFHEVGHHVGWVQHRDLSEKFANEYARKVVEKHHLN